ncbi:TPA: stable inheritance protein KleA [Proteus mirabilis]|uniref:stable inheritance protein KleA n=1 Tax=Proteus mirabilis TaxID=584 RepID=UPI00217EAD95|nr:stable inheritance protein KleA [Proteus mirabilis]MCS6748148.1 stable inheritance protein KleA [Proteus mirabilis]HEK2843852.1 stable inheritance protein KleA [Proteus mirabilis]
MRTSISWVNFLPNVEKTNILEQKKYIESKIIKINELEREISKLREDAYFLSLKLEGNVKKLWSLAIVDRAKRENCS